MNHISFLLPNPLDFEPDLQWQKKAIFTISSYLSLHQCSVFNSPPSSSPEAQQSRPVLHLKHNQRMASLNEDVIGVDSGNAEELSPAAPYVGIEFATAEEAKNYYALRMTSRVVIDADSDYAEALRLNHLYQEMLKLALISSEHHVTYVMALEMVNETLLKVGVEHDSIMSTRARAEAVSGGLV